MRILFAGTPAIAVPSLEVIVRDFEVVGVLTAPDTPSGRGRDLRSSPVKESAQRWGLPVFQPTVLDAAVRDQIATLQPDLLVSFAYGKIFGPKFLGLFPRGGINVHPSLLPKYRGPSPITAAILHGDSETGISVQQLALAMDSGAILSQVVIPLRGQETTGSLTEVCAELAAPLLASVLADLDDQKAIPRDQDETQATYCRLIVKDDGWIDWSRSAVEIERQIRAYVPWPRAQTWFQDGPLFLERAILREGSFVAGTEPGTVIGIDKQDGILVQTGRELLAVQQLQAQSRKSLDHLSFANGYRDLVGTRLGVGRAAST